MAKEEDERFFERLVAIENLNIDTVFDVGSYNGHWSNLMHRYFPDASYHLFEPRYSFDPALRTRTVDLWSGREKVKINPLAVAEDAGTMELGVRGRDGVGSSLLIVDGHTETEVVQVETVGLDGYAKDSGVDRVDFLKMDIQGAELSALKGAVELLKSTQFLYLETWTVRSYGGVTPMMYEIFDFVRGFGFVPFDFLGKHYNSDQVMAHVDVVYVNPELASLPDYLYRNLSAAMSRSQAPNDTNVQRH